MRAAASQLPGRIIDHSVTGYSSLLVPPSVITEFKGDLIENKNEILPSMTCQHIYRLAPMVYGFHGFHISSKINYRISKTRRFAGL